MGGSVTIKAAGNQPEKEEARKVEDEEIQRYSERKKVGGGGVVKVRVGRWRQSSREDF